MTITDRFFAFFGVPAATGHSQALECADAAISSNGAVIDEAQRLEEAIRQLDKSFGPTDGE